MATDAELPKSLGGLTQSVDCHERAFAFSLTPHSCQSSAGQKAF
jgi:hypothetical protein